MKELRVFSEEILNGKLHILESVSNIWCSVFYAWFLVLVTQYNAESSIKP